MIFYPIEKYGVELRVDSTNCVRLKWTFEINNPCQAFKKERRKIYIITDQTSVLYVGEAQSSLKTRFQRACTSYNYFVKTKKARGGYKGYKWLNDEHNKERNLTVHVATFSEEFDSKEQRKIIEAIEGELVFLTRNKLGYWPKSQNEIHFENHAIAKTISVEIFELIRQELK